MLVLAVLLVLDWQVDISGWYYVLLAVIIIAVHSYGATQVSASFFIPIKWRGERQSNGVALTFDDGPLPIMTEKILAILKQHNATATFFCIGKRVKHHADIAKRIHEQGHLIGNHTFLHGKFFDLQSAGKMMEELKQTDSVIEEATGVKPRFFRPPYGVTNPNLAKAIRNGSYVTMGWSVRSFDTISKEEDKLFERVTRKLQGGDVILFHDYCDITIRILPRVLEHIQKVGLKVVRLDVLMNEKAYA